MLTKADHHLLCIFSSVLLRSPAFFCLKVWRAHCVCYLSPPYSDPLLLPLRSSRIKAASFRETLLIDTNKAVKQFTIKLQVSQGIKCSADSALLGVLEQMLLHVVKNSRQEKHATHRHFVKAVYHDDAPPPPMLTSAHADMCAPIQFDQ